MGGAVDKSSDSTVPYENDALFFHSKGNSIRAIRLVRMSHGFQPDNGIDLSGTFEQRSFGGEWNL